jgi:hypothetical protein
MDAAWPTGGGATGSTIRPDPVMTASAPVLRFDGNTLSAQTDLAGKIPAEKLTYSEEALRDHCGSSWKAARSSKSTKDIVSDSRDRCIP